MRSNVFGNWPGLRRILPWAIWLVAAAVAIPMAFTQAGVSSSPAVIDARVAALAPMRTRHRLRVSKILVQPGQPVKAGDLLVQMDTAEIDAELAVAKARLAYVEIMAGWRQMQLQDNRARTSHELAFSAERAALDVARIIAEAERDRSELSQLDANLEMEQRLVGDQLASADRLKAMRLQRAALAKKVEEYQAAVERARRSASGSTQRLSQWQRLVQNAKVRVAQEQAAQDDVRAAAGELQRKEIAHLEVLRKFHEIRAPFDGRVGEIFVREGELSADPAAPVITVVEEQSRTAIAYVGQSNAHRVHVGDVAKLVPRDLSGPPLYGRVTALAPNITVIPERFRYVPRQIEFGRNVYIQLDAPANLPGQAFDTVFYRGSGGGT